MHSLFSLYVSWHGKFLPPGNKGPHFFLIIPSLCRCNSKQGFHYLYYLFKYTYMFFHCSIRWHNSQVYMVYVLCFLSTYVFLLKCVVVDDDTLHVKKKKSARAAYQQANIKMEHVNQTTTILFCCSAHSTHTHTYTHPHTPTNNTNEKMCWTNKRDMVWSCTTTKKKRVCILGLLAAARARTRILCARCCISGKLCQIVYALAVCVNGVT